ncbi:hypothetical protein SLA2020_107530 [Shorea laevis]
MSKILKIPTRACVDSIVWHFDKYWRFSVKNAYLLALNVVHEPHMNNDNMVLSLGEWKHLWKLKVPPKIHVFLWRAIHNSLPSLDNLVKRGILQEAYALIVRWSRKLLCTCYYFALMLNQYGLVQP